MKKLLTLSFILSLFVFAACEKTEVEGIYNRQKDNETQFAKVTAKADEFKDYTKIDSKSGAGHIMYKEIIKGDSKDKPLYNDKVKVLYTGWFKQDWTKDDVYIGDNNIEFKNKTIFDSTADRGDIPSPFDVNGVVEGFTTALQHMNVGDKWEVWMPWNLGYGARGSQIIPGYTTLVFEIELKEILIK